ncbi:MAG: hypothetical protein LBC31_11030 [Treponema sp.]|nr:hypothetical protein [Treponema sp.]
MPQIELDDPGLLDSVSVRNATIVLTNGADVSANNSNKITIGKIHLDEKFNAAGNLAALFHDMLLITMDKHDSGIRLANGNAGQTQMRRAYPGDRNQADHGHRSG